MRTAYRRPPATPDSTPGQAGEAEPRFTQGEFAMVSSAPIHRILTIPISPSAPQPGTPNISRKQKNRPPEGNRCAVASPYLECRDKNAHISSAADGEYHQKWLDPCTWITSTPLLQPRAETRVALLPT